LDSTYSLPGDQRKREEWADTHAGPLLLEQRVGRGLIIFCARAARGFRRKGRIAESSFCSRNAHDTNVFARRARWRPPRPPREMRVRVKSWVQASCGPSRSSRLSRPSVKGTV